MNITIDSGWDQYLQHQVDSGKYPSIDDVVHEALRSMKEREQMIADLHRDIAIGIA